MAQNWTSHIYDQFLNFSFNKRQSKKWLFVNVGSPCEEV